MCVHRYSGEYKEAWTHARNSRSLLYRVLPAEDTSFALYIYTVQHALVLNVLSVTKELMIHVPLPLKQRFLIHGAMTLEWMLLNLTPISDWHGCKIVTIIIIFFYSDVKAF